MWRPRHVTRAARAVALSGLQGWISCAASPHRISNRRVSDGRGQACNKSGVQRKRRDNTRNWRSDNSRPGSKRTPRWQRQATNCGRGGPIHDSPIHDSAIHDSAMSGRPSRDNPTRHCAIRGLPSSKADQLRREMSSRRTRSLRQLQKEAFSWVSPCAPANSGLLKGQHRHYQTAGHAKLYASVNVCG